MLMIIVNFIMYWKTSPVYMLTVWFSVFMHLVPVS